MEDFMFSVFPFFFFTIFGLVLTVFIVVGIRSLSEWTSNNRQPVTTGHVIVIDKRTHIWGGSHLHNNRVYHGHGPTSYYVTFEFEDGERQEFAVSGRVYGQIAPGDTGTLTYQGTRFHDFQRAPL
ncbi:MAG: DUF2500 domain-containing protein [Bacillota bacterium]|jgi:hypothetical protein